MNTIAKLLAVAAALTLTACGGADPLRSGEQGRLQLQLQMDDLNLVPVAPIAAGGATSLVVTFPGEWDARSVEVESGDEAVLPSGTYEFISHRAAFLDYDTSVNTSRWFELKPTQAGTVRLVFRVNGELIDAITLEVRDAEALELRFFDGAGRSLEQNPTVKVGSAVELRCVLLGAQGEPLVVREGCTAETAGAQRGLPYFVSTATAETHEGTARFGELSATFSVTFSVTATGP